MDDANPPIDPTYGQRSALPDYYDGEDESVIEALTYLRSVRSEASAIPHLLVGEERLQADDEEWSHLGYYEDGAYTGAAAYEDAELVMSANQQAYYENLRLQFATTRSKLAQLPPASLSSLGKPSTILISSSTHAQYLHGFLYTSPVARELARTNQECVMLGLKRYASILSKRNFQQGEQENSHLGAWGWALLAKCREVGQLDSEDVSTIREVGKSALKLMDKIRTSTLAPAVHSEDGEVPDDIDGESSTPQYDKTKDSDYSTMVAMDILITIIGEEFGQRDLLEGREIW